MFSIAKTSVLWVIEAIVFPHRALPGVLIKLAQAGSCESRRRRSATFDVFQATVQAVGCAYCIVPSIPIVTGQSMTAAMLAIISRSTGLRLPLALAARVMALSSLGLSRG